MGKFKISARLEAAGTSCLSYHPEGPEQAMGYVTHFWQELRGPKFTIKEINISYLQTLFKKLRTLSNSIPAKNLCQIGNKGHYRFQKKIIYSYKRIELSVGKVNSLFIGKSFFHLRLLVRASHKIVSSNEEVCYDTLSDVFLCLTVTATMLRVTMAIFGGGDLKRIYYK